MSLKPIPNPRPQDFPPPDLLLFRRRSPKPYGIPPGPGPRADRESGSQARRSRSRSCADGDIKSANVLGIVQHYCLTSKG